MSKTVRKFMPDDIWNLGRSESWFSDMAKSGLHLQKVGLQFALFDKGEPKNTKYRIDIISPMPTGEQLEIYEKSGWQLVDNLKQLYIFSSPEEADYPELHTDPMEQSYTLTALNQRLKIQVILLSVCMVLFLAMMLSTFFLERTPILSMLEVTGIQRLLVMFVEIYIFYTAIRNYITVRRLKKFLSEGQPINHRVNWRKPRLINGFIGAFFVLTAFLTVCLPIAGSALRKTYTLPETSVKLPIVRLVDLERNADLKREVTYNSRNVDLGNRVRYDWSLMAPVQYVVNERGIIKNMMWDDNSGSYSPSIETHYYKLTFSSMGISVIQDLMERYVEKLDPKVTVQEVHHTFFNKLYVAEDGIRKQIFAYSGNEVIYVDYFGNKKSENIMELLPKAFGTYEK